MTKVRISDGELVEVVKGRLHHVLARGKFVVGQKIRLCAPKGGVSVRITYITDADQPCRYSQEALESGMAIVSFELTARAALKQAQEALA